VHAGNLRRPPCVPCPATAVMSAHLLYQFPKSSQTVNRSTRSCSLESWKAIPRAASPGFVARISSSKLRTLHLSSRDSTSTAPGELLTDVLRERHSSGQRYQRQCHAHPQQLLKPSVCWSSSNLSHVYSTSNNWSTASASAPSSSSRWTAQSVYRAFSALQLHQRIPQLYKTRCTSTRYSRGFCPLTPIPMVKISQSPSCQNTEAGCLSHDIRRVSERPRQRLCYQRMPRPNLRFLHSPRDLLSPGQELITKPLAGRFAAVLAVTEG